MGLVESVTLDSVKLTPNPPVNTNMPVFVLFEEAREPGGNPQRPMSNPESPECEPAVLHALLCLSEINHC